MTIATHQTDATGRDAYTTAQLMRFGFLNIDKPAGMTSHDVIDIIRRITKLRRVGHSGTLDPAVTGALPVGLHTATRLLEYLLEAGKTYDCIMNVHALLPEAAVRELLQRFVGEIEQMPPVRSRVVRQLRKRHVYGIELASVDGRDVRFTVDCEAGTYIRTLCVDFGKLAGVEAHMAWLRRLRAGPFHADSLLTLDELAKLHEAWKQRGEEGIRQYLYPPQTALRQLPGIRLEPGDLEQLRHGQEVVAEWQGEAYTGEIAVADMRGRLCAVAAAEPGSTHGVIEIYPRKVLDVDYDAPR